MRCKHFLALVSPSPKSRNQSPKIEDQISRYRSNSENTYIFLGFGGYCQTPSKIINGLKLLRASKSPAEHVGRLDMARLHITRNTPFTGSADLVMLSQSNRCLCGHLRSCISHQFCKLQMALGTLGLYLLATFSASCALFSVLKTLGKPL